MSAWALGFSMAVTSAICWASLDVVRKHIGQYMSASTAVFGVMICHIPIIVPFLCIGEFYPELTTANPLNQVLFVGFPDSYSGFFGWSFAAIGLNIIANFLFFRSVQISPLSLTTPYLAFTPIFTAAVAFFVEHQVPSNWGMMGIAIVCLGAFFLNPGHSEEGIFAPLKALWTERGSLYMLVVALIWSISPILNKRASEATSPMWQTLFLAVGIGLFFFVYRVFKDSGTARLRQELAETPFWIMASGVFAVGALTLQLASYVYIDVAYVETVKRAIGVISAILAGWMLFKEVDVARRLVAAIVMAVGVAMVLLGG